jgi:nucleotide-binding universal stress UspA family protein
VAAATRAAGLARRTGARIVLLHVDEPEAPPADWDELQRALAPLLEGVAVLPLLRRGPVAREILAVAHQEHADLIVMTRHGRWQSASAPGFPRFLLHSVICRTMLAASCPVWIEPEAGAPAEISRLLCGVLSLVHDRDTIGHAAGMAAIIGARLTLFRSAISAAIAIPGQAERSQAWQQDVCAAVAADLEALRGQLGVPADIRTGVGNFVAALLQDAATAPADLIAVRRTSRDWGQDEALHPLVRGTPVPVLIYPGEPPRVMPAMPVRTPLSRFVRSTLFLAALVFCVWLMHRTFEGVRQPDCSQQQYRCAFRENLIYTTSDRINQTQPRADPKLGPFNQATPKDAPHPQP